MVQLKKPPFVAAQTQGPAALFDPFWNGGQHWKGVAATEAPSWHAMAGEEAIEHLEALLPQFQGGAAGWKALRLTPVQLDNALWSQPAKLDVLEGLLTEIVKPHFHSFIFIMPVGSIIILLHHPESNGLVPLVYRIGALLVGEENAPRMAINLQDLSKPEHTLPSWPEAVRTAMQQRAERKVQQQHDAAVHWLAEQLTPAVVAQAVARRGGVARDTILVVEDDPSTAMLLSTLLESMAPVRKAASARQAAEDYPLHLPALVFLDLGLPDVDGLTLLKHIQAADPAARVVILTANATQNNLQAARALGACGFMAKPFTRAKLQETLQRHGLLA